MAFDFNGFIENELNEAIFANLGEESVTFFWDDEDGDEVTAEIRAIVTRGTVNRELIDEGDNQVDVLTVYVSAPDCLASALNRLPTQNDRFTYNDVDYVVTSTMYDQGGVEMGAISSTAEDYLTTQDERRSPRG